MWYKGQRVIIVSDHHNTAVTDYIGKIGTIINPAYGCSRNYDGTERPYAEVEFPHALWNAGVFYQNMRPVNKAQEWFYEGGAQ